MNDNLNKRTLIVGLGKTGLSCARFLSAHNIPVAITDTRDHPPGLDELSADYPDIALFLGGFEESAFAAAEQLIVSPGVAVSHPYIQLAISRGADVIGDIEIFARTVDKPVLAITGSNGKSTVTAMLAEMAKACGLNAATGGNFGIPALDLISEAVDFYILELSSFQLETTHSLKTISAVVLNVSEDHMDRYASFDDYIQTKRIIYRGAKNIICNIDENIDELACSEVDSVLPYTLAEATSDYMLAIKTDDNQQQWMMFGQTQLMPVSDFHLPGTHNLSNALAAWGMGLAAGWDLDGMANGLSRFRGLPHRSQFVQEISGVRWFNDSKATNPGATLAALNGFNKDYGNIILIAGGQGKDADFSGLGKQICTACNHLILLGEDAEKIAASVDGCLPVTTVNNMVEAVLIAHQIANAGDVVLLSPACASFDMFNGYEDRGDRFIDAVMHCCEVAS